MSYPEEGNSRFLRNVCANIPDYSAVTLISAGLPTFYCQLETLLSACYEQIVTINHCVTIIKLLNYISNTMEGAAVAQSL
jgi:hypothetical protein